MALEDPILLEAVVSEAIRVFRGRSGDYVIEEIDPKGFGCFAELSGDFYVGSAGTGVSAGVVVDANYSAGAVPYGFSENFSWMNETVTSGSGGHFA